MIIESKFKDYYDNCVGFGVDKMIVYRRETKKERPWELSRGSSPYADMILDVNDRVTEFLRECPWVNSKRIRVVAAGFCGKIYLGLEVEKADSEYGIGWTKRFCYWHRDDFGADELAEVHSSYGVSSGMRSRVSTVAEWFKRTEGKRVIECPDLFLKHKLVSFFTWAPGTFLTTDKFGYSHVTCCPQVIIDPCLKDHGFGKVMDGVTAFQEISMHLANCGSNESAEPAPLSEKGKVASKGFDKHSFRSSKRA